MSSRLRKWIVPVLLGLAGGVLLGRLFQPTAEQMQLQVPPELAFLYDGTSPPSDIEAIRQALPYDSIILSRGAGFGPGRTYDLAFSRDGGASYMGWPSLAEPEVHRLGAFAGKIDLFSYARLALAVERMNFMATEEQSYAPCVDCATTVITVVHRGRRVSHHGVDVDRVQFWLLTGAMEGLANHIGWSPIDAATPP
jgi:hypothetical protein